MLVDKQTSSSSKKFLPIKKPELNVCNSSISFSFLVACSLTVLTSLVIANFALINLLSNIPGKGLLNSLVVIYLAS